MDLRKIKKLIDLVQESDIDELEITEGEESVRICRHRQQAISHVTMPMASHMAVAPAPAPVAVASAGKVDAPKSTAPAAVEPWLA